MQYRTLQFSTVQYNTVLDSTYSAVQNITVQCSAVRHSAVQYNTMQYNTVEYNAIQSCNRSLGFAKGLAHLQWLQNVQQAQQCCGGCGSCRGIAIGPILSTDMHFWSYVWAQVKCVGCCKSSSGFNSTIICNKNYEFAFGFEIKCNNCVFQVLKAVATVANWGHPPHAETSCSCKGGQPPFRQIAVAAA